MELTVMEIPGRLGESYPKRLASKQTREALAAYVAGRWPVRRRKAVEAEWELTSDQARSICEGNPSAATVDHIWKHPNGGWAVLLPVMGSVIGVGLDQFIEKEKERLDAERRGLEARERRRAEMVRDLRVVFAVGGSGRS